MLHSASLTRSPQRWQPLYHHKWDNVPTLVERPATLDRCTIAWEARRTRWILEMENSRGMGSRWNMDDFQNHFVASFWVGCESGWSRRELNIGAIICDIWGGSQMQSPYQTVRASSIQFSFPTHSVFVIRYSPCRAMRLITRTNKTCAWEHGYNHCFLHHLTDRSRDLTNDPDVDDLMDDVMVPGRRFTPRLRQKWFQDLEPWFAFFCDTDSEASRQTGHSRGKVIQFAFEMVGQPIDAIAESESFAWFRIHNCCYISRWVSQYFDLLDNANGEHEFTLSGVLFFFFAEIIIYLICEIHLRSFVQGFFNARIDRCDLKATQA
jgi:hypothetical protein